MESRGPGRPRMAGVKIQARIDPRAADILEAMAAGGDAGEVLTRLLLARGDGLTPQAAAMASEAALFVQKMQLAGHGQEKTGAALMRAWKQARAMAEAELDGERERG